MRAHRAQWGGPYQVSPAFDRIVSLCPSPHPSLVLCSENLLHIARSRWYHQRLIHSSQMLQIEIPGAICWNGGRKRPYRMPPTFQVLSHTMQRAEIETIFNLANSHFLITQASTPRCA